MVRRTLGEPCRKEKITRASTWEEGWLPPWLSSRLEAIRAPADAVRRLGPGSPPAFAGVRQAGVRQG